jgi:hypothetical protein
VRETQKGEHIDVVLYPRQKFSTVGVHNEDELGRACSTHGRDEKCVQNIGRKT